MSKSMIEEALIDAQKLKELAVENARRDIIEKITPRIKELVESRMMEDSSAEDSGGTSELDEDDEVTTESGDYEMSSESLKTMAPILRAAGDQNSKLELSVANLGESVQRALRVSDTKRQESEFISGISQLFSTIQDIYSHVHESRTLTTTRKAALEQKLESHFAELNEGFKEISMKKLSLREADEMLDAGAPDAGAAPAPGAEDAQEGPEGEDVVITLKGLNGVDAESLNVEVEVESPDEEEGEEGGADLPAAPDADGGGDDVFGEGEELSGDTILEISDVELKKEIARMRRLSEGDEDVGKRVPATGKPKHPVEDFGGGSDDGDPWLDHDVTVGMAHLAGKPGKKLKESDEDMEESLEVEGDEDMTEAEDMDESDDCDESQEFGGVAEAAKKSVVARQLKAEKARQLESQKKIAAYKTEARKCRGTVRETHLKKRAAAEFNRIKESQAKVAKLSGALKKGASNSGASNKLVKENAELRNSLDEQKLFSAKLLYANKLLQTEGVKITADMRDKIYDYLDSAESLREAKELYVKLSKKLTSSVNESVRSAKAGLIAGSSSRSGRTAGTTLNESADAESVELDRWATLAGIKS